MITTSSLLKLAPRGSYFLMNAWSTLMSVEWKINTIGTHLWTKSVFIWKLQNFAMLGAGPLSDSQQWTQASVCFHMATWAPSKSSELFPSGRAQKEYSSFFQKAVQVFFRCKAIAEVSAALASTQPAFMVLVTTSLLKNIPSLCISIVCFFF